MVSALQYGQHMIATTWVVVQPWRDKFRSHQANSVSSTMPFWLASPRIDGKSLETR